MSRQASYKVIGEITEFSAFDVVPFYVPDLKRRVNVAHVQGDYYAFDGLCTHEPSPLSSGQLSGTTIKCPSDGSEWDVTTGWVVRGPATASLGTYPVLVDDGKVMIRT